MASPWASPQQRSRFTDGSPFVRKHRLGRPVPRSPGARLGRAVPRSPATPCTPTKPLWLLHCDSAVARCPYPCGFALWQGSKSQDRLSIDCRGGGDVLWAVFDGHRDRDVAGHASKAVPGLVWRSPLWPAWPGEALSCALRECHEVARHEGLVGGSTALLVAASGGHLWCCSAGDSRAVAGLRGGGVRRLSVDHTTSAPQEVARLKASGGNIEWGMLGGVLPMTRGLGNFDLEADGFACQPQVGAPLPRQEVEFVVLASDGLWDVVGDEACCALVRDWGAPAGMAAERLAAHARTLGSSDDIAIIVAYVGWEPAGGAGHGLWQSQAPPPCRSADPSPMRDACCFDEDAAMACTQSPPPRFPLPVPAWADRTGGG